MRTFRLSTALVVAAFASVLSVGSVMAGVPMPPEKQTGSVGDYTIRDSAVDTAATCHYNNNLTPKVDRIAVVAPRVFWPDQNSSNDTEHGKVRFWIVVQKSTDGGTTWSKVASSTPSTGYAYEMTKAPLTRRTVSFSVAGSQTLLRVLSKIRWYNPNGSPKGTVTHWYSYARYTGQQLQGTIEPTPCPNKLLN
jgi:hypothetical protein